MSTASEDTTRSPMQFRLLDHATSGGIGDFNEDQSGHTPGMAWMFDGATDTPETYRPCPNKTGAYWIAQRGHQWLLNSPGGAVSASLVGQLASAIQTDLKASGMPSGSIPPVTALGIAVLDGDVLDLALVGDVFVHHPASSSLLSDPRFGDDEKAFTRFRSVAESTEAAHLDFSDRRRGYLRGDNNQWVLGDNPAVSRGVISARWTVSAGDRVLLATDGFARAVTDYSIASDWDTLTRMVIAQGAAEVMASIRAFEDANHASGDFFKKSDDVCVALYEIA